jgi:uncharacterized protein with PQ loop repeat
MGGVIPQTICTIKAKDSQSIAFSALNACPIFSS